VKYYDVNFCSVPVSNSQTWRWNTAPLKRKQKKKKCSYTSSTSNIICRSYSV